MEISFILKITSSKDLHYLLKLLELLTFIHFHLYSSSLGLVEGYLFLPIIDIYSFFSIIGCPIGLVLFIIFLLSPAILADWGRSNAIIGLRIYFLGTGLLTVEASLFVILPSYGDDLPYKPPYAVLS